MSNTATGRLTWHNSGDNKFETGVDRVVLYVKQSTESPVTAEGLTNATTFYSQGVAWNGVTSVSKSPSGAEANDIYADNIKYASIRSAETFGATIEAYTYPDAWAECDGSAAAGSFNNGVLIGQQRRKMFGFCFRTDVGSDADSGIETESGYKLHLVYNATASPSESSYSTINDSPEAITFSWELSTIPAEVGSGYLPTACITIDSTKFETDDQKLKLKAFEDILYGKDASTSGGTTVPATAAMLPMPKDVIDFFTVTSTP